MSLFRGGSLPALCNPQGKWTFVSLSFLLGSWIVCGSWWWFSVNAPNFRTLWSFPMWICMMRSSHLSADGWRQFWWWSWWLLTLTSDCFPPLGGGNNWISGTSCGPHDSQLLRASVRLSHLSAQLPQGWALDACGCGRQPDQMFPALQKKIICLTYVISTLFLPLDKCSLQAFGELMFKFKICFTSL